jgi:Zn-dependent protease with chaperone function
MSACVGLASFGFANLLLSLGLGVWLRFFETAAPREDPDALLALRLLPSLFAAAFALGLAVPAFVMVEPAAAAESPGLFLIGAATLGLLPIAAAGWRASHAWRASRALERELQRRAVPIAELGAGLLARRVDTVSGLVGVVGFRQPRLYISSDVLGALDANELNAAVAHELAHARSGDNLRRMLLSACPDWLSFHRLHRRLFKAWCEAAELRADADAAGLGRESALALAAALLAVARLGPRAGPAQPMSALDATSGLERRVRRLAEPAALPAPNGLLARALRGSGFLPLAALPVLAASVAASPALATRLHALLEAFVQAVR